MTIVKTLAQGKSGGYDIAARELTEKSGNKRYQIVISKDSIVVAHIPAARTTVMKRFKEMTKNS